jgi:hypothetical protein
MVVGVAGVGDVVASEHDDASAVDTESGTMSGLDVRKSYYLEEPTRLPLVLAVVVVVVVG